MLVVGFVLFFLSDAIAQRSDSLEENGRASFYHDNLQGLETSNGEIYNMDDFTAAHRTFPFNTLLLVTNKSNQKSVVVRINDRGPFVKSRIIDLSRSSAKKIGMIPFGVVPVQIEILNFFDRFPLSDSLLNQNEVVDCFSKSINLQKVTLFIWKTDFWKHAFYMASSMALEYKNDYVCVYVSGPLTNRTYQVLITNIDSKGKALNLIRTFRKSGFSNAALFHNPVVDFRQ